MEVLVEIVFEILGSLFGALIEVAAEVLLQMVLEALAEVGIHITRGRVQHAESSSKWRLMLGYPLLGAIVGALSLLAFPHTLAPGPHGRLAALLLAPLGAALSTVALGRLRARRGQQPVGLDRMAYAYLFALALAAVRYVGTA